MAGDGARWGAFVAPYGAPTAGPPPYELYRLAPAVVLGFGTDEALGPRTTRWRFLEDAPPGR